MPKQMPKEREIVWVVWVWGRDSDSHQWAMTEIYVGVHGVSSRRPT